MSPLSYNTVIESRLFGLAAVIALTILTADTSPVRAAASTGRSFFPSSDSSRGKKIRSITESCDLRGLPLNPDRCNGSISYLEENCRPSCSVRNGRFPAALENVSYSLNGDSLTFAWTPASGAVFRGVRIDMVTFTSAFSAEMVCAEIVNPNATSCSLTAADFQMLGLGLGNFELNDLQNYAIFPLPSGDSSNRTMQPFLFKERSDPSLFGYSEITSLEPSLSGNAVTSEPAAGGLPQSSSDTHSGAKILAGGICGSGLFILLVGLTIFLLFWRTKSRRQPDRSNEFLPSDIPASGTELGLENNIDIMEDLLLVKCLFRAPASNAFQNSIKSQSNEVENVFVIYGTQDEDFAGQCRRIVYRLIDEWGVFASGIEDNKEVIEGQSMISWVQDKFRDADFLLLVCNQELKEVFESSGSLSSAAAAAASDEFQVCCQQLQSYFISDRAEAHRKVIPIVLSDGDRECLPILVGSQKLYNWNDEEESIVRIIRSEPEYIK
eukprot:m.157054 g.157054  ORF g.157054 m.157054 type:complete len:495 (+) comp38697_c0_seq8:18-1502(+)